MLPYKEPDLGSEEVFLNLLSTCETRYKQSHRRDLISSATKWGPYPSLQVTSPALHPSRGKELMPQPSPYHTWHLQYPEERCKYIWYEGI